MSRNTETMRYLTASVHNLAYNAATSLHLGVNTAEDDTLKLANDVITKLTSNPRDYGYILQALDSSLITVRKGDQATDLEIRLADQVASLATVLLNTRNRS